MKKNIFALIFVLSCATQASPLPTAQHVEIERYVGNWYTISSLPQFFTRNCLAQTAEYGIINPQTISVLNTCLKKKGKSDINGQAVVVNTATNAELEVTFNNFFTRLFRVKGDYTIIKLDQEYRYVLVGSKDRKSLWILSRTKVMPQADYQQYIKFAGTNGFDVSKMEFSIFNDPVGK